jgi:predicted AlkP superfamily phosphohydrolase/phosphomutase
MTNNSRRRVLFIVLDGADLTYLRPWLDEGRLPNIASVVEQGALMPLASTIINFTHVAWPSLFTGKNPGKTGITDITLRKSGSHDLVPATLQGCQAEPFWVFLGEQGLRTLVFNVPMTYPPRPLNGMLTCGFDTPEDAQEYAWPKPTRERLDQRGYRADVLQAQHRLIMLASTHRRKLSKAAYLEACNELTQRTLSHLEYLLAGQEWDVAFIGYHPTDWINHFTADRDTHLRVYLSCQTCSADRRCCERPDASGRRFRNRCSA